MSEQLPWGSRFALTEVEGAERLRRTPFRFSALVAHGTTVTLKQLMPADGTVEKITVRFYAGPQLSLHVRPYLVDARGVTRDLVAYAPGGKSYIDGDNDVFEFALREPVRADRQDTLCVEFANTDAANDYNPCVDIEVDFAGGVWPMFALLPVGGVS